MYLFDVLVLIGVLLALAITSWPKRAAIVVCVAIAASALPLNYFMATALALDVSMAAELIGAFSLLVMRIKVQEKFDKHFFSLMAMMLGLAAVVTRAYNFDYVPHAVYEDMASIVAITHVALMLAYSDGTRNLVGNIERRFARRPHGRYL